MYKIMVIFSSAIHILHMPSKYIVRTLLCNQFQLYKRGKKVRCTYTTGFIITKFFLDSKNSVFNLFKFHRKNFKIAQNYISDFNIT